MTFVTALLSQLLGPLIPLVHEAERTMQRDLWNLPVPSGAGLVSVSLLSVAPRTDPLPSGCNVLVFHQGHRRLPFGAEALASTSEVLEFGGS